MSLTRLLLIRLYFFDAASSETCTTYYLSVSDCFTQEVSSCFLLILSLDCDTHKENEEQEANLKFHPNDNTSLYW